MLAVQASEDAIQSFLEKQEDLYVSNLNSNKQTILGGSSAVIDQAIPQLKEMGFKVVKLPVSAAFHTHYVDHARIPFAKQIDSTIVNTPQCTVLSNTTGKEYTNQPARIKELLKNHLVNPVLFKKQIDYLYASGVRTFIEIGPKSILKI